MTDSGEEIRQLKAQNASLKEQILDLNDKIQWSSPEKPPEKGELEQKLRQVYQNLHDLLNDDGVALVYQIVVDDIQRQVFNTMPGQSEDRERLYYQAQGLQAVWVKMAAVKRGIERALEEEAKQLEDANDQ